MDPVLARPHISLLSMLYTYTTIRICSIRIRLDLEAQELYTYTTRPVFVYDLTWTRSSDVWAFGVTLWEIFTDTWIPYPPRSDAPGILERTRNY